MAASLVAEAGSSTLHVDAPVLLPEFVIEIVIDSPAGVGSTPATRASKGPMPARTRRPTRAITTTTTPIARKIVPWAWVAAGCARPSGLQNSHMAVPSGTSRPQRTHDWVGAGRTPALG